MLERRARANVAQLGLNHRPQVAGRVVPEFNDFAGLTFENYDHAASDLGC